MSLVNTCPRARGRFEFTVEEGKLLMRVLAGLIHDTASELSALENRRVDYKIGTLIELPRAAVRAGPIAKHGSFILVWHERPHADDLRLLPR